MRTAGSPQGRRRVAAGCLVLAFTVGLRADPLDDRICLQVHCFDPLVDPPVPPDLTGFPATLRPDPLDSSTFELFQADGPFGPTWFSDLLANGAVAQSYFRGNTSLAKVDAACCSPAPPINDLRWRDAYLPSYRLSRGAADTWLGLRTPPLQDDGLYHVSATFMGAGSPAASLPAIQGDIPGGAIVIESHEPVPSLGRPGELVLGLTNGQVHAAIESLARTGPVRAIDFVGLPVWAGPAATSFQQMGQFDLAGGQDFRVMTPLFAHGLDGDGQVIGVADIFFRGEECHFVAGSAPADFTPSLIVDDLAGLPPVMAPVVTSPGNKVITSYLLQSTLDDAPTPWTVTYTHGNKCAGAAAGDAGPCRARDRDLNPGIEPGDEPFAVDDCNLGLVGTIEHVDSHDGIAPAAQLVLHGIGNERNPARLATLLEQAYETEGTTGEGARVQSNSYMTDYRSSAWVLGYGPFEEAMDRLHWRLRDDLILFAAGNYRAFPPFQSNPSYAKSVMIVGATMGPEPRVTSPTILPWESLWTTLTFDPLFGHSAHGPGAGGTVKPDLVAAGEVHVGGVVDPANGPMGVGDCINVDFGATSAATPVVAGLAAEVRQYFMQGYYPSGLGCSDPTRSLNPTNALVRAVLINSTRNLGDAAESADDGSTGGTADRPTFGQGWGVPILTDTLYLPGDPRGTSPVERSYLLVLTDTPNGALSVSPSDGRAAIVAQPVPAIAQDDVHTSSVLVSAGEDLHVTLSWIDPPADAPSDAPVVNDLDLEVQDPSGSIWRPNAGTSSVPGADPDRSWSDGYSVLVPSVRDALNTVENIFIPASEVVPGAYTLRVIGRNVPGQPGLMGIRVKPSFDDADGDADGDTIDSNRQGYALIASGLVSHARGMVHFDRAAYRCGDLVTIKINDANIPQDPLEPPPVVTIVAPNASGDDLEVVVADRQGVVPPLPAVEVAAGAPSTPGDGIVQFVAGGGISVTYNDADPAGWKASACARTTPFVPLDLVVSVSDACGQVPGIQRNETLQVVVRARNMSAMPIARLTGSLSTPPGVTVWEPSAVFGPTPLQPGEEGIARFIVEVDPTFDCSASLLVDMLVQLAPDEVGGDLPAACGLVRVPLLLDSCTDDTAGPSTQIPGEVPNTSVRVAKQGVVNASLTWAPATGAADYRVFRGDIQVLHPGPRSYDHAGRAGDSCTTSGALSWTDNAVLGDLGDYYYLVGAVSACGLDGPVGSDSQGVLRPAGGGCP